MSGITKPASHTKLENMSQSLYFICSWYLQLFSVCNIEFVFPYKNRRLEWILHICDAD